MRPVAVEDGHYLARSGGGMRREEVPTVAYRPSASEDVHRKARRHPLRLVCLLPVEKWWCTLYSEHIKQNEQTLKKYNYKCFSCFTKVSLHI